MYMPIENLLECPTRFENSSVGLRRWTRSLIATPYWVRALALGFSSRDHLTLPTFLEGDGRIAAELCEDASLLQPYAYQFQYKCYFRQPSLLCQSASLCVRCGRNGETHGEEMIVGMLSGFDVAVVMPHQEEASHLVTTRDDR